MVYPKPTVIISLEIKGSYIPDFTHLGPYRLLLNGIKGSAFISFKDQSLRACYVSDHRSRRSRTNYFTWCAREEIKWQDDHKSAKSAYLCFLGGRSRSFAPPYFGRLTNQSASFRTIVNAWPIRDDRPNTLIVHSRSRSFLPLKAKIRGYYFLNTL